MVVSLKNSLESIVGLMCVGLVAVHAHECHLKILPSISQTVVETELVRVSVVIDGLEHISEDSFVSVLLAKVDLWFVSEVVGDVIRLVAVILNFLKVSNLHFLKLWGNLF